MGRASVLLLALENHANKGKKKKQLLILYFTVSILLDSPLSLFPGSVSIIWGPQSERWLFRNHDVCHILLDGFLLFRRIKIEGDTICIQQH